eukprot:CAMPEP_0181250804 /NCGR_PEP_ID=MMETSP1096-20121128/46516_1 /TAXON_ID=156174 ORGANISM="Chrysochromulina ericina, Strain CCMP281" /NCGR_SAMPLE_ID=MMETSP1096 /ASSEMBLY_ACC=CAM_ASM_000453 /LENGTH=101 /DNA_ID=CAMNT_0023348299 /DNA_START=18 /DNA_END=323 /DNA_ORIENTATION=-
MKLSSPATFTVSGAPATLPKAITLNEGWTFVPNPHQDSVLAAGIPEFGYAQGDQFKGQFFFAEYYASFGFYGSLSTLEPGSGYKCKVRSGGAAVFRATGES